MKLFKSKLFLNNFIKITIPLLSTFLATVSLSTYISISYSNSQMNKNSINILNQIRNSIDLILNEINYLNLNFTNNVNTTFTIKNIMNSSNITYAQNKQLSIIKEMINSPSNAKPYIDSIYIWVNNPFNRILTSSSGIVTFDNFKDTEWFDNYNSHTYYDELFTEIRTLKSNSSLKEKKVLTVYNKTYSPGLTSNDGLIIININLDYIEQLLLTLKLSSGEGIYLMTSDNEILSKNSSDEKIDDLLKMGIIDSLSENDMLTKEGFKFKYISSSKFNIKYVSVIKNSTFYRISLQLTKIFIIFFILSIILGLLLSYYLTKKSYKNISDIYDIIEDIKKGNSPKLNHQGNDEYDYIIKNIINNFLKQDYLKMQLSRKKYKLKSLELIALQSQINPHFLSNTLETVNMKALALTKKPNEVNLIISSLSSILKYSLTNPYEKITIKDELDNTNNYLNILKIRYKDKFICYFDIDNSVLNLPIAKLIFQPLIENSIYHGIKEKAGIGKIKIRIKRIEKNIRISIIDNGIGMSREKLLKTHVSLKSSTEDFEHIGLYNVNKRLSLIYNNDYSININSKLGYGTAIYLNIPYSDNLKNTKKYNFL